MFQSKPKQTHTHAHKYFKISGCWRSILKNIIYVFIDINHIHGITLEYEHCFMCLLKYPFISCVLYLYKERESPVTMCESRQNGICACFKLAQISYHVHMAFQQRIKVHKETWHGILNVGNRWEYYVDYCRTHRTLLWMWIMLCEPSNIYN